MERTIAVLARPITIRRTVVRRELPAVRREVPALPPVPNLPQVQPSPYVDYARVLTAEGGILITYKDIDRRWRHTLWRLFAWTACTGFEGWFLSNASPLHSKWIAIACVLAVALINWLIVAKPVEIYRSIEIRPDCMILDGTDIFWLRQMEAGWPSFRADDGGNQVLGGIYGTRFVEYLTIPRFDEEDRAPEVFAAHLQDAMQQLWARPI